MRATSSIRVDVRVETGPLQPFRTGAALRAAVVLSMIVAAVMALASALGVFVADLYPEPAWAVAALRGNDLVALVLVVPVVAAAPHLATRGGSATWGLLWLGALLFNVYNYAYYVFGTAFNDVFLLHVACFALSIVALVLLTSSLDAEAVAPPAPWGRPARLVSAFMLFVGSAIVLAWGGFALRFAFTGELPADVMPPEAIHLVYALDMSLLAPSFLLGGILLWRQVPWGHVLGVAVNAAGLGYLIVLEVVGGFQANAGIAGKTWVAPPAIIGGLACAAAVATLLRQRAARAPGGARRTGP